MAFLGGPLILFYNSFFGRCPKTLRLDCCTGCRFSTDRGCLPRADAVVFHLPTMAPDGYPKRHRGQAWVAWSMESSATVPALADPAFMRRFEMTMTYRRSASVWTPYFGAQTAARLPTPPATKTEAAPAVYMRSRPANASGRIEHARTLMRYLKIDSYGRMLGNRQHRWPDKGHRTKIETIRRYRFTLAFENSIDDDYVTEKFFDPLTAGSVPVYLGAPNIADFAPAEKCFIDVASLGGPRAAADLLNRLAVDDDAYLEYLAWKARPLKPGFLEMVEAVRADPMIRLCRLLQ